MRPGKLFIWVLVAGFILAFLWLAFGWLNPPSGSPVAHIELIGYTNLTLTSSSAKSRVFPGHGNWLCAQMMVTNESSVSISYRAWGGEPQGFANAQTEQGMTNGFLAPGFTASFGLLKPGCSARFRVLLPANTLKWECGFHIAVASMRERVFQRALQSKWIGKFSEAFYFVIRILPHKAGTSVQLKSQMYEISSNAQPVTIKASKPVPVGP